MSDRYARIIVHNYFWIDRLGPQTLKVEVTSRGGRRENNKVYTIPYGKEVVVNVTDLNVELKFPVEPKLKVQSATWQIQGGFAQTEIRPGTEIHLYVAKSEKRPALEVSTRKPDRKAPPPDPEPRPYRPHDDL